MYLLASASSAFSEPLPGRFHARYVSTTAACTTVCGYRFHVDMLVLAAAASFCGAESGGGGGGGGGNSAAVIGIGAATTAVGGSGDMGMTAALAAAASGSDADGSGSGSGVAVVIIRTVTATACAAVVIGSNVCEAVHTAPTAAKSSMIVRHTYTELRRQGTSSSTSMRAEPFLLQ